MRLNSFQRYVVVAGGQSGRRPVFYSQTTEIYDVENDVWSYGPDMPAGVDLV